MLKPLLIAAAVAALAPAAPALADPSRPSVQLELQFGSPGYRDQRHRSGPNISRWQAIRIAESYGLIHARDVELRRGVWEIRGPTRHGWIEVEINARNGRVIDVDRHRGRHGHDRDRDRDRRGWGWG